MIFQVRYKLLPAKTVLKVRNRVVSILICALVPFLSIAQTADVKATLDTNTILIGGQFTLNLEVNQPAGLQGVFPVLADTFSLLEVIKRSPIDTVPDNKGGLTLKQNIVLTSFDSGFHVIPPVVFNFKNKGDTTTQFAESKPLLITVQSIPIDTTGTIKDIKGQMIVPYTWQDALPYILAIVVLGLLFYFIRKYLKNRKPKTGPVAPVVPARPAHEIALEQLAKLDEAKLWQQGNFKGYYTSLSDIIRTFIEHRWMVNAMEMTTDEILHLSFITELPKTEFEELKYLLVISDLAKFAKMTPVVYENEQCMKNAVSFVKNNKLVATAKEVSV